MNFLLKENILSSVRIQNSQITIINRPSFSLSRLIWEYKTQLLANFKNEMNYETFLAFSSIFLGNPNAKKKETVLKSQLKQWGLFHYIARAGLHVVIFVSIWMFIFGLLPISWALRQFLMILICCIYFIFTWPSIPFNRAIYTLLLVKCCGLTRVKAYVIPTLSCVALMTLMTNPLTLFALDFQLSFGVTYALAWFNEIQAQRSSY